jgi:hypothetical protein
MNITELQAVNLMRGSIGKAPVSSLTSSNPDIIAARSRLRQTTLEAQATSWWFNTETTVTLVPNTADEIIIPSRALEVRPNDPFAYLTTRGDRMFDPTRNTFKFESALVADMIVHLDYDQLPFVAANYIQYEAARKFQADFDGDPARVQDLRRDAQMALMALKEAEQRNRRSNVLLSGSSLRLQSGIRPHRQYSRNPTFPGG